MYHRQSNKTKIHVAVILASPEYFWIESIFAFKLNNGDLKWALF
jgi:hypothetical protein